MRIFLHAARGFSRTLTIIGGVSLTFLMLLTVLDVILRAFHRPVVGTYELVALAGALAIGFSMPFTSWMRAHVYVDSFINPLPRAWKNGILAVTRLLVTGLFFLLGINLLKYGTDLRRAGEVSLTLQIPFYPVAFAIGICCFVQCLVMFCDILRIFRGEYE